ncbi:hypothetical protein C3F09_03695, partial [candidate division GN15 bacterium]
LPGTGVVLVVLWAVGEYNNLGWLSLPARTLTAIVFVLEVALMLSLPFSGLLHGLNHLLEKKARRRSEERSPEFDHRRRLLLKGAAAAIPLATLATSARGITRAYAPARVYLRPMAIPDLPAELEGFRIFHLSDLHLGHYVTLEHLAQAVTLAQPLQPHLTLVTGDVSDDLSELPTALNLIYDLKPPYGTLASLGNHEYFRGIKRVRQIFDQSPVPLLVNNSTRFHVSGQPLFVGAIDDPRSMMTSHDEFFRRTVTETLAPVSGADTVVLMSHRPNVFDFAAVRGVHLTLSGHTHGGQIGFMGRSVFELHASGNYLWGEYTIGTARLYTSSGAGHWFPFRLGCPTEAPVIELRRFVNSMS